MSSLQRTDSSSAVNPTLTGLQKAAAANMKSAGKKSAPVSDSDSDDSDDSDSSDDSGSDSDSSDAPAAKKPKTEVKKTATAASSKPKPKPEAKKPAPKAAAADEDEAAPASPKAKKARSAAATAVERKAQGGIERTETANAFVAMGEVFAFPWNGAPAAWKVTSVGSAFRGALPTHCPMNGKVSKQPDWAHASFKKYNFTATRTNVHGDELIPNSEESFVQTEPDTFHHLSWVKTSIDHTKAMHNFDLVGAPMDPPARTEQTLRQKKLRREVCKRAQETGNVIPNPEKTGLEFGPQPFIPWSMYRDFLSDLPVPATSKAAAAMEDVPAAAAAAAPASKSGTKRKSPSAAATEAPQLNANLEALITDMAATEVAKLRAAMKGRSGSVAHAIETRFKPERLMAMYSGEPDTLSAKEKEAVARALAAFHPQGRVILDQLALRYKKEEEEEAEKLAVELA